MTTNNFAFSLCFQISCNITNSLTSKCLDVIQSIRIPIHCEMKLEKRWVCVLHWHFRVRNYHFSESAIYDQLHSSKRRSINQIREIMHCRWLLQKLTRKELNPNLNRFRRLTKANYKVAWDNNRDASEVYLHVFFTRRIARS